ncbi:MAG: hypothetical protein NXH75_10905, partial [Halobacteriovoraceae bacterium]|nr:hypothetical protein [Halobacteriovoraceae bacterium]
MMVNLYKMIQGRTKILSTLGLFALVGLSSTLQNFSQTTNKITTLQDGIQTCFTRVHNSYTARLIGSGSEYLQESFVANTEECLGEAIRVYENLKVENISLLDDLNGLSTDVNWFHQKVTARAENGLFDGNPESVLLSNIGSRFEKLDIKKEQVISGLGSAKNIVASQKKTIGFFFFLVAGLVPLFLFMDYLSKKSQEDTLSEVEEAAEEILKAGNGKIEVIHSLVQKALLGFGFKNLGKLYESYIVREAIRADSPEDEAQGDKNKESKDEAGIPIMLQTTSSRAAAANKIEEIWTETTNQVPEKKRPSVELEAGIGNVIDIVSSKIFTQGIQIDINTEPVKVYGEEEPIEQAFYHLLVNSIENYDFDDPKKYLSINVRKLGATVLIDFFDSGREFSKEFL